MEWKDSGYPALRTKLDDPMAKRLTGLMREISPELIVTRVLPCAWPVGVPSDVEIWVQMGIQDPAAVVGGALTNAVLGITP